MKTVMKINKNDNVAIALHSIKKGDKFKIEDNILKVNENIDFGHKIALTNIAKDTNVIKYGEVIGYATQEIKTGDWVHMHNLYSNRGHLKGEVKNSNEV